MYGNVAPTGAVAKITGKEGERFQGTAKVFDSEEDMLAAISRQEICGGMVVVIRYEGPKGGQTLFLSGSLVPANNVFDFPLVCGLNHS